MVRWYLGAWYKSGSAEKSDLVLLGSKTELVKVAVISDQPRYHHLPGHPHHQADRPDHHHHHPPTLTILTILTKLWQMLLTILTMAVALLLPSASPLPRHLGRSGRQVPSPFSSSSSSAFLLSKEISPPPPSISWLYSCVHDHHLFWFWRLWFWFGLLVAGVKTMIV